MFIVLGGSQGGLLGELRALSGCFLVAVRGRFVGLIVPMLSRRPCVPRGGYAEHPLAWTFLRFGKALGRCGAFGRRAYASGRGFPALPDSGSDGLQDSEWLP